MLSAVLHGADRRGDVSHQIDLFRAADKILVNGLTDAVRMSYQHINRTIEAINPGLGRHIPLAQVAFSLRLQRILHLEFDIGAYYDLLRGIHCSSPRQRFEGRSIHTCTRKWVS